jgi:ribulose bisphosphate carboxylase small subunit
MRMATETLHEVQDASDRPRAVMVRMVAIDSSRQTYSAV